MSTEQLGFSHSEMSRDEEPGAAQLAAELYEWVCARAGGGKLNYIHISGNSPLGLMLAPGFMDRRLPQCNFSQIFTATVRKYQHFPPEAMNRGDQAPKQNDFGKKVFSFPDFPVTKAKRGKEKYFELLPCHPVLSILSTAVTGCRCPY